MISYLSLGSNLSPRHHHIDEACRLLSERVGHITARSSDFYSAPWGYTSSHEYLNIALCVETTLTPQELLEVTQQIERELGRTVKNLYQDRTIDIDILLYYSNDGTPVRLSTPELTIPHPRMEERPFVQVPLAEIFDKKTGVTQG